MSKIEIYCVTTNRPDKAKLNEIKVKLCNEYGGLTILKNCEGLWVNEHGIIESDKVQIWRIITDKIVLSSTIINMVEKLKEICAQKSQLFTINGKAYFV